MRQLIFTLVTVLILTGIFSGPAIPAFASSELPEIIGTAGILIDANSGKILYNKNMDFQLEPASTTKIITCLLALENLDMDAVVTIDSITPFTEGSRIYLLEGEEITVKNLLYALMLESANDAAVALAIEMAGSVEEFAVMMNARAKELGALSTTFLNPNGLHEEGHVTTVSDLAMIAKGAMKNEQFREIVRTYRHVIPATNMQEERYMYNTNRLIYDEKTQVPVMGVNRPAKYEGAIGIKTGYTSHAQSCLVAGALRDGTELIAVVMQSSDAGRFGDCIAMLDYGFANYRSYKAVDAGADMGEVQIKKGAVRTVATITGSDGYVTLPPEASDSVVTTKVVMNDVIKAPIAKGDKVGVVEIYEGSELITTVDILATGSVDEGGILSTIGIPDTTAKIIFIVLGVILTVFLVLLVTVIILRQRQIKRRKARRARRAMEIAEERQRKMSDYEQRKWPY